MNKSEIDPNAITSAVNNYLGYHSRVQELNKLLENLNTDIAKAKRDGRESLVEVEVRTAGRYIVSGSSLMMMVVTEMDRLMPKLAELEEKIVAMQKVLENKGK